LQVIRDEKGRFIKGQHASPSTEFKRGQASPKKGRTYEELYGEERAKELREKLAMAHKGQKPWNKGLRGEEVLKHYNDVKTWFMKLRMRRQSEETRRRRSESLKKAYAEGRRRRGHTEATRKKISESLKGHAPWNKGKKLRPLPEEHRKKISEGVKEHLPSTAFMKGIIPWNYGLTADMDERVKRYAEARRGWRPPKEAIKKMLTCPRPNKCELRLLEILRGLDSNWRYVGDGSLVIDGRCPDFWDGGNRLVELFGGFWHGDDDPQERVDFFARRGYDCVVVWDSELKDVEGVIRKIKTLYPEEVQIEKVQVKQGT
jgi:hypothetical protein